jgi:hypothetical protein
LTDLVQDFRTDAFNSWWRDFFDMVVVFEELSQAIIVEATFTFIR